MVHTKVLVFGHSWVRDLQQEHDSENFDLPGDVDVIYASYPGANLHQLQQHLEAHLNDTFTHIVVFTVITEAYRKVDLGEGRWKRSYDVIEGDDQFSPRGFLRRFGGFVDDCRSLCPGVKVILMVPPYLDLIYYNERRVSRYPAALQLVYKENPRFDESRIHEQITEMYYKMRELAYLDHQLKDTIIYQVINVVHNTKKYRKYTAPFLSGERRTLGGLGFLWDGVHPSRDLIKKLWKKMCLAKCFEVREEMPPAEHYFMGDIVSQLGQHYQRTTPHRTYPLLEEASLPAESSKDKSWEPEKCEIEITNFTETVPHEFFVEMSKRAGKEAICKFEEDYIEITFDSHIKGHLFADYLDNLAIGDTLLKTSLYNRGCKKDIPKLRKSTKKKFRDSLQPILEFWLFTAAELARKNIRENLNCQSFKTVKCEESDCDVSMCIFYHNDEDRRRNPYSIPYRSHACKYMSSKGECNNGDKCQFAHNCFESTFHPFEIYFNLCPDYESRIQCFSANPLCPNAHLDSPETFFTQYWKDSLTFGTPVAVEFLAGAIQKFNLFNPIFKDCRIFFMGASTPFLHNVRKAVSHICRVHMLHHEFVGERGLVFESDPLLFGTPSKFLESVGHLFLHPFTLIIISQIDVILPNKKERKALINFFARCKMPFAPPYLQTLFVADERNSKLHSMIKHYLNKDVNVIKKPEHKVKFRYTVPYKPLTTLPKWLNTGGSPTQVYPFLSTEVVDAMRHGKKKQVDSKIVWFKKKNFFSSDSSASSDSSDSTNSEGTSSSKRGKRKKSHYDPSSSRHRSRSRSRSKSPPNPSRSPSRRQSSSSRCSPKKPPIKRSHSRQSYSPKRTSCGLVSYARSSSSSVSPERLPAKKKFRVDEEEDIKYRNYRSHPSRQNSAEKNIQNSRIRSPQKGRFDMHDAKNRDIKPSPSPFPPPPPSLGVPPKNISEGKSYEEQKNTILPMDRIVHRSILVEFAAQSFSKISLKKELGDDLYKEFEEEKEKTCFMLEEEFNVYKNMPELCEKYEECYDGFMKMYLIKYPNYNEEHKETLWKKFWKSKFDSIEKNELQNRMASLIEEFRKMKGVNPSFPPPPIISGLNSNFRHSKAVINKSSERHRPSAVIEQTRNSKNMEASSSSFSFKLPSSNALASTSGLSYKSLNSTPTPPPPPNISNLKHRFSADHIVEEEKEICKRPTPPPPLISDRLSQHTEKLKIYKRPTPPPPTISDRTVQSKFSKGFCSNETSSDSRFTSMNAPLLSDDNTVPGTDQQHTSKRNLHGDLPSPSYSESIEEIVRKISFRSGIGFSIDGSKREAPPPEKAHSSLAPTSVASLPAHIMALAKGFSSELKNKNEVSSSISNLSSSFSTPSVTSRNSPSVDKESKGNSPMISSKQTSTTHQKGTVSGGESSFESFSMDKAITDLESIVPDIGILGPSIMTIIKCSKEEGINSKKAFKTFTDPDNISLIQIALKKLKKEYKGREELYFSLERSINGLIKHSKQELEKKEEEKEISLNYKAIAEASLKMDTPTIIKMIRTVALYEGIELTKKQEVESYVKVCSIQFDLTTNK